MPSHVCEIDCVKQLKERLDKIVDVFLAYRPKAKTKAALRRKRQRKAIAKNSKPLQAAKG
jgi:hypothetical protein